MAYFGKIGGFALNEIATLLYFGDCPRAILL